MRGKYTDERYVEIAEKLHNSEDLIDFVQWYANRLKLTTFIDDDGDEVESDLQTAIEELRNAWETELEKPTRNWKLYKEQMKFESEEQESKYLRGLL